MWFLLFAVLAVGVSSNLSGSNLSDVLFRKNVQGENVRASFVVGVRNENQHGNNADLYKRFVEALANDCPMTKMECLKCQLEKLNKKIQEEKDENKLDSKNLILQKPDLVYSKKRLRAVFSRGTNIPSFRPGADFKSLLEDRKKRSKDCSVVLDVQLNVVKKEIVPYLFFERINLRIKNLMLISSKKELNDTEKIFKENFDYENLFFRIKLRQKNNYLIT